MRWKIAAGALVALAFLIPAAPALAQTGSAVPSTGCQTGNRIEYKDLRKMLAAKDLDKASDIEVRVLAVQILSVATTESLPTLPGRMQERLDGTADDLRAFLKSGVVGVWTIDLRITVNQTMSAGGPHVKAAAQEALDAGTVDAYLAFLNDGQYVARAIDCASASPSASASSAAPSASASQSRATSPSPSVSATATAATLPTTGANTAFLALGGAVLVLVGVGVVLAARRSRRA